jgi:UPF0716 protein FxsA
MFDPLAPFSPASFITQTGNGKTMLGKLLFAFIAIPLVEFMLLVWIADKTSVLATIALVIVTGIVGSLLARAEGIRAWRRFNRAASEGRLPGREIQDGLMIAFAAALLLTPGILTDLLGFALLIPLTRGLMRGWLAKHFADRVRFTMTSGQTTFYQQGSSVYPGDPDSSRPGDGQTVDATGWTTVSDNEPGDPHGNQRRSNFASLNHDAHRTSTGNPAAGPSSPANRPADMRCVQTHWTIVNPPGSTHPF